MPGLRTPAVNRRIKLARAEALTALTASVAPYSLTNFSALNYFQTQNNGGESGIASGFGIVKLVRVNTLGQSARVLGSRRTSSSGWQFGLRVTNDFYLSAHDGSVFRDSPSAFLLPSDVSRIHCVIGMMSVANGLQMWLDRRQIGTSTVIGTYASASAAQVLGADSGGTFPSLGIEHLATLTFRGTPTATQIETFFDTIRALGDLPSTMFGATVTHRWSVRDQLRALGGVITTGQTAPATLDDTTTAAAIDAFGRQGSPTVVTIDSTSEGRRVLGVQGGTDTAYLEAAGGINGNASGWFLQTHVLFRSGQASTTRVFLSCNDDPFTAGWNAFTTGANANLYFGVKNAGGADINLGPVALSASVLDRTICLQLRYNGTTFNLFIDGVLSGSLTTTFKPVTSGIAMRIGRDRRSGLGTQGTAIDVYAIDGGNAVVSDTELAAAYTQTARTGRLTSIPGKSQHSYPLGDDILAANESVPDQILDRIGTAHLVREGLKVHADANSIRGIGPFNTGEMMSSSVGITGQNAGFNVIIDIWLTKLPTAVEWIAGIPVGTGNGGWFVELVNNLVRGSIAGVGFTNTFALVSGDLNKRLRIIFNKTATTQQIFVNGVQGGADTAAASYTTPTKGMVLGSYGGTEFFTSGRIEAIQGGNGSLTAGEITTINADLTTTIPVVVGKTDKRWLFEQDIASASGSLPTVIVERVSGSDDIIFTRVPLQVAQRTERVWGCDASPLMFGTTGFVTASSFYSAATATESTVSFWRAVIFRVTSQAVSSATRMLFADASSTVGQGWSITLSGLNATLAATCGNLANGTTPTNYTTPTTTIAASEVGKLFLAVMCYDSVTNKVNLYARRVLIGAGTTTNGVYTPSSQLTTIGCRGTGDLPAEAGVEIYGTAGGNGALTLSEVQAFHDAVQAKETMALVPGKTDFGWVFDIKGNAIKITGSSEMTKVGTPTVAPCYTRAWSW